MPFVCGLLGHSFWPPLLGFGVYNYIDGDGYLPLAKAFQNGELLTNPKYVFRVPLFPSILAFYTLIPIDPIHLLRFWQILLDILTLSGIYLFTQKYIGRKEALLTGYLYAFYPLGIYRLAILNTENLQATAIVFWVMGIIRFWETKCLQHAILLSFMTGFVLYLNPAFQFVPIFITLALLGTLPFKKSMALIAAFLLPLSFICLSWGLRNYTFTGDFFLFDVRSGITFWLGNHQKYQGRWEGPV